MRLASLACASLALLIACEKGSPKPATQVLVTVDSDLVVGSELTSVQIEVRTTEGARETPRHTFELASDAPEGEQVQLPFSFGVSKVGQDAFQLRVTGLKGDQTVVDLRWNVSFEADKTLGFSAFLGAVCAGNLCTDGQTCYPRRKGEIEAGACADVPDASTSQVKPGEELGKNGMTAEPAAGSGGASGAAGVAGRGGAGSGAGGAGRAGSGGAAGSTAGAGAGCGTCRPGETCVAGACQCATTFADYFPDADGDGHGDPKLKQSVCGAAPAGFVTSSDDCCDSDKRAFPGQTQGDATPSACTETGFDFDCDGTEELGWPFLASGTCCLDSQQEGWEDAVPECGESALFDECDEICEVETASAKQRCR